MKEAGPLLSVVVTDRNSTDAGRAEALKALERLEDPARIDLARKVLDAGGEAARVEALRILVKADPASARTAIDSLLEKGGLRERQGAFAVLAENPDPATDKVLAAWLDRLIAGKVPAEIQLDLIEAAGRRPSPEVQKRLDRYEASRSKTDPLAAYRETLAGGDVRRGLNVFLSKAEVSCLRCHKVKAPDGPSYGGEVGPELDGHRQPAGPRVPARVDRDPRQEDRPGLRVGRPGHDRRQGRSPASSAARTTRQLRLITAEGQPSPSPRTRSRTASAARRPCPPTSPAS